MATPTLIEEKYLDKQNEITAKLERIQEMLDKHSDDRNVIHYGHVGDMAYVSSELDKLIEWIK